jgi:DNA-binding NarL/FixJ family response regulator
MEGELDEGTAGTGGPVVIAQIVRIEPDAAVSDPFLAEQAWRDGDVLGAIEAADRALTAGTDSEGRAAAVAAAGAAADGALLDAATRWRGVGGALVGAAAARAAGRAALAAALAGDVATAVDDLATARDELPDPAPRGLTVLLGGAGAVIEAVGGALDKASRHLSGLAAASVAPDPMAAERLDELAVVLTAAGGDLEVARAMLRAIPGAPSRRARLVGAWLDLRTGHLAAAREDLAAVSHTPLLRRDALLGAAVTVGLARRSGDAAATAATWARVAPVVAGTDVELLLLDVWGELSVVAEQVSPTDRDLVVDAMRAALHRAGSPWWAVAIDRWWQLERAVVAADPAVAADAAAGLTALAASHPRLRGRAEAATAWAAVLAGRVCPQTVDTAAALLADDGLRDEAAALCRAAAQRTSDPAATRRLLGAGRGLRPGPAGPRSSGLLSEREREVGALVLDGLTQKEIGARLYISPKTVEQHVARMRQKLAASNRATLVAALRTHL